MSFYFRPDNVPELDGLSRWEQRVLLRGTFLKERAMSTLVLLVLVIASVQFLINPLLASVWPNFQSNSVAYGGVLVVWLLLLMWLRDVVMMNVLRPKIAIKRAEKTNAAITESA